jgi:hypothetical protein
MSTHKYEDHYSQNMFSHRPTHPYCTSTPHIYAAVSYLSPHRIDLRLREKRLAEGDAGRMKE